MSEKIEAPNKTAHNEIQKLRATFCDGCGIAAASSGLILPFLKQTQEVGDFAG